MKKLFTILFSLMFIVSINALGVSGTFQEVKTKTVVLQTHSNVIAPSVAINTNYDLKAVQQFNFEVLQVDNIPLIFNLNAINQDQSIQNGRSNYINTAPLVPEPIRLSENSLNFTANKYIDGRCLLLFPQLS